MEFFFILILICIIFTVFDANRFIAYEGNMKRGIKMGSDFVSEEIDYYLRNLSFDITSDETKAFIRKENQTVLIQPITSFFHRNLGLWYIGIVDLSKRRLKITYYTPFSGILFITILVSMFAYQLFTGSESEILSSFCIVVFIPFFYLIAHPFSKRVVLKYIEENMQSKPR